MSHDSHMYQNENVALDCLSNNMFVQLSWMMTLLNVQNAHNNPYGTKSATFSFGTLNQKMSDLTMKLLLIFMQWLIPQSVCNKIVSS